MVLQLFKNQNRLYPQKKISHSLSKKEKNSLKYITQILQHLLHN